MDRVVWSPRPASSVCEAASGKGHVCMVAGAVAAGADRSRVLSTSATQVRERTSSTPVSSNDRCRHVASRECGRRESARSKRNECGERVQPWRVHSAQSLTGRAIPWSPVTVRCVCGARVEREKSSPCVSPLCAPRATGLARRPIRVTSAQRCASRMPEKIVWGSVKNVGIPNTRHNSCRPQSPQVACRTSGPRSGKVCPSVTRAKGGGQADRRLAPET